VPACAQILTLYGRRADADHLLGQVNLGEYAEGQIRLEPDVSSQFGAMLGQALTWMERLDAAEDVLRQLNLGFRRRGAHLAAVQVLGALAELCWWRGRWR